MTTLSLFSNGPNWLENALKFYCFSHAIATTALSNICLVISYFWCVPLVLRGRMGQDLRTNLSIYKRRTLEGCQGLKWRIKLQDTFVHSIWFPTSTQCILKSGLVSFRLIFVPLSIHTSENPNIQTNIPWWWYRGWLIGWWCRVPVSINFHTLKHPRKLFLHQLRTSHFPKSPDIDI